MCLFWNIEFSSLAVNYLGWLCLFGLTLLYTWSNSNTLLAQEYFSFSQLKTMLLWGAVVLVAKNFTELT